MEAPIHLDISGKRRVKVLPVRDNPIYDWALQALRIV